MRQRPPRAGPEGDGIVSDDSDPAATWARVREEVMALVRQRRTDGADVVYAFADTTTVAADRDPSTLVFVIPDDAADTLAALDADRRAWDTTVRYTDAGGYRILVVEATETNGTQCVVVAGGVEFAALAGLADQDDDHLQTKIRSFNGRILFQLDYASARPFLIGLDR